MNSVMLWGQHTAHGPHWLKIAENPSGKLLRERAADGWKLAVCPIGESPAEWTGAESLAALEYAAALIPIARKHFPKSIQNSDTFQLENTCATIGRAIYNVKGGQNA